MKRVFFSIPNVAFHKIIKQYAFEMGRPVMTVKQQQSALVNYTFFAQSRN